MPSAIATWRSSVILVHPRILIITWVVADVLRAWNKWRMRTTIVVECLLFVCANIVTTLDELSSGGITEGL